jgi:hypothetical protein
MLMTHAAAALPPDVATKVDTYRRVLQVSIALNILIALFVLIWPGGFTALLNLPDAYPLAWPRLWAALWIGVNLLYIPGAIAPLTNRYPNIMGIAIRLGVALLFLIQGGGFIWMALYEAAFGVALLVTYRGALRANLMSKP